MNTVERQARNDQIVALKARGLTYDQIAAALDISRITAIRAVQDFRDTEPQLRTQDPLKIIDLMLEGYQADLNELAMISNSVTNPAVQVGAINSRMAARDRIIGLLQVTGVLPRDLGKLKVEIDVRYIADRLVSVLEKYDMPEEAHDEVIALLGSGDVIEGHKTAAAD